MENKILEGNTMQNIINKIINGQTELVRSFISTKYQSTRQAAINKLKIEILTVEKLIDPIYITSDFKIIDGWKRLSILQELYTEGFKLKEEPTVIVVDGAEQEEELYIAKNIMVNRFTKSWLAIVAAENNLPECRRLANARRGSKQNDKFNACSAAGLAFGISDKLVQQADDILKSKHAEFFRKEIRLNKITVTNAHEIVKKELESITAELKKGKTYRKAMNSKMRNDNDKKEHDKFQQRQEFQRNNPLDYQKENIPDTNLNINQDNLSADTVLSPVIELKTVHNNTRFIGVLDAYCSPKFKAELVELLKKHMPNTNISFVTDINKVQQYVHENLQYRDSIDVA